LEQPKPASAKNVSRKNNKIHDKRKKGSKKSEPKKREEERKPNTICFIPTAVKKKLPREQMKFRNKLVRTNGATMHNSDTWGGRNEQAV